MVNFPLEINRKLSHLAAPQCRIPEVERVYQNKEKSWMLRKGPVSLVSLHGWRSRKLIGSCMIFPSLSIDLEREPKPNGRIFRRLQIKDTRTNSVVAYESTFFFVWRLKIVTAQKNSTGFATRLSKSWALVKNKWWKTEENKYLTTWNLKTTANNAEIVEQRVTCTTNNLLFRDDKHHHWGPPTSQQ